MRQDELAARFGSSITPVREAMRLLEAEGLVVSEPHRGVRVAGVDLDHVTATYILRRLTESYAMQRATLRVSPHDLNIAQRLLNAVDSAATAGDQLAARAANREFHFFFYDRCGLPTLAEQIDVMWKAFPWDLMLTSGDRAAASQQEHVEIMDAVRDGDPERALAALGRHIRHGFSAITAHLTGSVTPDPFEVHVDWVEMA